MDLAISGQAKDGEAVLIFLESLFSHNAFAEPVLLNEIAESAQLVRFNLRTRYRIGGVPDGDDPSHPVASDGEAVAGLEADSESSSESSEAEETGGTENTLDDAAVVADDDPTAQPAEPAR